MGLTSHQLKGNNTSPSPRFACIILRKTDRIRAVSFPHHIHELISRVINDVWKQGIQKSEPYKAGGWEWQLKGDPWEGQGSDAIPCRRLVATLLAALSQNGWHFFIATTIGKTAASKDGLIFRPGPSRFRTFCSISFNETDKIRLIDAPSPSVLEAFSRTVSAWPLGVQSTKQPEANCLQMKLKGNPWTEESGTETFNSRTLSCDIIAAMEDVGLDLVGSINVNTGIEWIREIPFVSEWLVDEGYSSADTWFFATRD